MQPRVIRVTKVPAAGFAGVRRMRIIEYRSNG